VTRDVARTKKLKTTSTYIRIINSTNQGQVLIVNENKVAFRCPLCSLSNQVDDDTTSIFDIHRGNILDQRVKRILVLCQL
jgi:predicted RNA-binding Zn-ribbon protein involved in translation (DUF1610 family)